MPVHAPQLNDAAVNQQFPVLRKCHGTEPERNVDPLPGALKPGRIQDRRFRVPENRIVNPCTAALDRFLRPIRAENPDTGLLRLPFIGKVDGKLPVHGSMNKDIPQMLTGTAEKIHIPENPVIPERILILQIGAAGPGKHDGREHIVPVLNRPGEIKFRLEMRSFGQSHILAVQIKKHGAGNALKDNIHLFIVKMTVHEFRPVDPYRILPRDIRRHERNRIIDIQILFLPVAKALPAPRNGYPVLKPDTAHRLRNLKHRTEITEIPFAVQHPDSFFSICPFRQIIRSRLFQIFTQNVRIRNFPCYQEVFLLLNTGLFPERLCLRPGFDPLSLRDRANPLKSGLAFLRIPGPPDQSPKYRPTLIDLPLRQTGQLYMNPTWYAILSGGKKLPNARSPDMCT